MGLNLSNQQIAQELDLNIGDVQVMTEPLRAGIIAARPAEKPGRCGGMSRDLRRR
jgi:hypothetical protein